MAGGLLHCLAAAAGEEVDVLAGGAVVVVAAGGFEEVVVNAGIGLAAVGVVDAGVVAAGAPQALKTRAAIIRETINIRFIFTLNLYSQRTLIIIIHDQGRIGKTAVPD